MLFIIFSLLFILILPFVVIIITNELSSFFSYVLYSYCIFPFRCVITSVLSPDKLYHVDYEHMYKLITWSSSALRLFYCPINYEFEL